MRVDQIRQFLIAPAITILSLAGIISLQQETLEQLQRRVSLAEYVRQEQVDRTNVKLLKRLPSFGFSNMIANWAFLQFIQYYGDNAARDQTGHDLVPEYFDVIVNRDPRFVGAYLYLSTASSIYAARPDRTVALMNQGLQSITPEISNDAFFVWLYKGVDEILFLGDANAARYSYEMAAKWASLQPDPKVQQIATQARETANFLAKNPESKRVRVSAWAMILGNARDDKTRQVAIREIQKLGGQVSYIREGGAIYLNVKPPEKD
jgi:hypothetical protein